MASGFVRLYCPCFTKNGNLLPLLAVAILCSASYLSGIFLHRRGVAPTSTPSACRNTSNPSRNDDHILLSFDSKYRADVLLPTAATRFPVCPSKFSEHTPCEDPKRSLAFPRNRLVFRERHCPPAEERLRCLVPAPRGYLRPFQWPESRGTAWFANVPHKELTVEKAVQNWIRVDGDKFLFPGGGTMFPAGADAYIKQIEEMIPLRNGLIRTAVDTGCGVASWGAYLLSRGILAMSIAPRDTHEAQVQFALERGVPAMIGIMASMRLPYPSRAFDMAHCSRCLIPWHRHDGQYLMEVDRILRPGGYWLLSGPPINWETHSRGWERTEEDLDSEQKAIEAVAVGLCWKKLKQQGDIAIWQKPINHLDCSNARFCSSANPDSAWYTEMQTCITPLPEVAAADKIAGGELTTWPERLTAVPPRILTGSVVGVTKEAFLFDTKMWKKRVDHYKKIHRDLDLQGRYRNILDMNSGFGGFAAALVNDPVWVMNTSPTIGNDTLGVIYERGLIGTYHDWCEAMSTYPRTYDLIHSDSVFSLYKGRCPIANILLEMDRLLRPEGAVILRDEADVLVEVQRLAAGMRWDLRFADHDDGRRSKEKILLATKKYWTIGDLTKS